MIFGICAAIFGIVGLVMLNITWLSFLIILAAIIFKVDYPIFSLTHISLIGTPIELLVGGLILIILAAFCERLAEIKK